MLSCMLPFNCLSLIFKNMTSSWKSVKILLSICPLSSLLQYWRIGNQWVLIDVNFFFLYCFVSYKMLLKLVHDSQNHCERQSGQILFPFHLRLKEFTASREAVQDGRVRHGDYLLPHKYTKKYICMWNSSYRTPTEYWQKTPDFQKGTLIST